MREIFSAKSLPARRLASRSNAGFTLAEVMVATSILLLVSGGALAFMNLANVSISGITAQTTANAKAGYLLEFLQSRTRLATSISNSANGNILTLGFDDNVTIDSTTGVGSGDGKTYNDQTHYERFQFIGINSTNAALCATNKMVYTPNITSGSNRVLVARGFRNLPRFNIFTITNQTTIIVRFGIVDTRGRDYFQGVDIQGTALSLNRASTTNIISIIP